MKGWISIHRSIKNHWLYPKGRPFTKYEAWITILLEVNHADIKESKGFNLIECKRGESLKSLDTWAKIFHWNKSKVRRFFIMLQNDSMIETKNVQKTTHLRVCNYGSYQNERNETETKLKRKRNETETELTPNNNVNNEKNVNKEINTSVEIKNFTASLSKLFPENITSKLTDKDKWNWIDTVDKLIRIDKFTNKEIEKAVKSGRNSEFWNKQFLSISKLRKKNKDDIKYINVFLNLNGQVDKHAPKLKML